jgi:hypothetical protein
MVIGVLLPSEFSRLRAMFGLADYLKAQVTERFDDTVLRRVDRKFRY